MEVGEINDAIQESIRKDDSTTDLYLRSELARREAAQSSAAKASGPAPGTASGGCAPTGDKPDCSKQ